MFTVRCTKKLLSRLGEPVWQDEVAPSTKLGDWYGNLLFTPGRQVVLFVSERTLLPVVVAASPADSLLERFQTAVSDLLLRVGIPAALVEVERREMREVRVGKTENRQVLGSMNDFAYLMDVYLEKGLSLANAAERLARTPCSPIEMKYPVDVVLETFAAPGKLV